MLVVREIAFVVIEADLVLEHLLHSGVLLVKNDDVDVDTDNERAVRETVECQGPCL